MSYSQQKTFEEFYFEASKQKILNNQEKALKLFQSALETYPKSDATMYQLARLFYQMDQYNQALYWSEKAVSTSKNYNKWYFGQLAQFYNRFGKYEESAKVFQSMIGEEPDNKENYIEAANQFFNAKKYQESIAVLMEMQTRFGIEEASSTRLEYVYTSIGESEMALAELEKLSKKYPTNTNFKGYLSDGYMKAGQTDKAIQQLKEIVALDSNEGFAYYALYNIYDESGDKDRAFYNLKKAFQADNLDIQQKLQATSSFFLQLKKNARVKKEMLELSDILVSKYPNIIEPYILKTDIYATLEDYVTARNYALEAIKVNASDFKSWSKLLSLNAKLNDPNLQIEDTERAIELFPNMAGLYTARAYALMEVEKFEEAANTVNEGLEVAVEKPDKLELLLCGASCYNKLENYEKSDGLYEKILNMSPNNS
ncbi:MAG: tetratricopeptide repeat protein, partial [Bacteroidia bacterium]|nr:tetratricopeptide repeat protein [Bacteroidia bacterium]